VSIRFDVVRVRSDLGASRQIREFHFPRALALTLARLKRNRCPALHPPAPPDC
jgi:hypothetical protein